MTAADQPVRPKLPARVYEASRTGLIVPRLGAAAAGRTQTPYRRYFNHVYGCRKCVALNAQCEAAQKLWAAFREARAR